LNHDLQFDYTTIGHVTIDVFEDGSRRAGGTAFYSALQAARLGLRAAIVTSGRAVEIEALLEPYRDELALRVLPAEHTTTLRTTGSGAARSQRVLAWAGAIAAEDVLLDTAIAHLAPVARETPAGWSGRARFVGLTPQGLARRWNAGDGLITQAPPTGAPLAVVAHCDALVVSEQERESCAGVIAAATAAGAVVAVTAGAHPTTILLPGGEALALDVPALADAVDDLGAGDVFAAAFFVALSDGRSPRDAAVFANAAAAVRMRGAGAAAIGDRAAIETRLLASAAPSADAAGG
jgi:sugar/nucleoside kinase (ribokinase family)